MKFAYSLCVALAMAVVSVVQAGELWDGFIKPPKENKPQVWWWFDMNAPDEAITRDLEGMWRVGVSGFHVYGGDQTNPKWIKKVKFALKEANRLGLDGVITIGAAGCGHKETEPKHAQKDLVMIGARLTGGGDIKFKFKKKGVKETPANKDGTPKYFWDVVTLAAPVKGVPVKASEVLDVSQYLNQETDEFLWPNAPKGDWKIVRFGYVPKVFGWIGCYIDHMSTAAFDAHWKRAMDPLLSSLDKAERKALKGVMCDSWEAGTISWTDDFAAAFKKLRGYDLTPYLMVRAGMTIESKEASETFTRDFAETVSELIAERHYAYQKKVANAHGLISIAEAAGPHQRLGDVRRMQGRCDVAMGEFWMPSPHRPTDPQRFMLRDAASAAHVYGMKEVLAESFTGKTHWTDDPRTMKPCADRAFCDGLTRVCYHGFKLSASLTEKPGKVYDFGTHYNPQLTWFEESRAFNQYLSRVGYMLSQGRSAADCLLYAGDAVGLFVGMKDPRDGLGEGYDYDLCPTELLLKARVENNEIVLPSGARYKKLKLCDRNPKTIENMRSRDFGAPKDYPRVEVKIPEEAKAKVSELLKVGGEIERDVVAPKGIDWIHRKLPRGEIYFLSNQEDLKKTITVKLRDVGDQIELWNPVTGEREARTIRKGEVKLSLPEYGSVFVVSGITGGRVGDKAEKPREGVKAIDGIWQVTFDKAWGGPKEKVAFDKLTDWTQHADAAIRYYSGTAVYEISFDAPKDYRAGSMVTIDLGEVKNVAEVYLNEIGLGVAWTRPFEVKADRLKPKGNKLLVRVTNLWPNRLIGDMSLPEAKRFTKTNKNPYTEGDKLLPSGLLGPVQLHYRTETKRNKFAALEEGFAHPPREAKPQTWWHWMNGNVTKEGITADLEAMAEIGLGGAQIFDAGCEIPPGPIKFNSPDWFAMIEHAAKEARRLGMELCLPNCSGWSSSGGPWITPDRGMKLLGVGEVTVEGPRHFHGEVPRMVSKHGYYRDIAVIAFPTPKAEGVSSKTVDCEIERAENRETLCFKEPFAASGVSFVLDFGYVWTASGRLKVEVSEDGENFCTVIDRSISVLTSGKGDHGRRSYSFPKTERAKIYRVTFTSPENIKTVMRDLSVDYAARISDLGPKTFAVRQPVRETQAILEPEQVVGSSVTRDLTRFVTKDDVLDWEVPEGRWTILRLGFAANGMHNHPASENGTGLEVDKLSDAAMDFHINQYIAKLVAHLGPLAGKVDTGLNNILVDSYEVGSQNWTEGLEKEFARRTGYAMTPYYPVLAGYVVGSMEESERFLEDYRRVIADLFAENYAGALAKKCHELGLVLSLEPGGSCPADNLQYGEAVDIPMGEFWSHAKAGDISTDVGNSRFTSFLGHVWGRKYIAMEAFTGGYKMQGGSWMTHPYALKAQGDRVFAEGVNRIIFHRFVHQPWPDDRYSPGITMGKWGMHFDRNNTWWKQGKDWITYLSRAQFMLQEGKAVSDVLFYAGEYWPNDGNKTDDVHGKRVVLPQGYCWDACATAALLALRVEDGKIVTPGGMRYEFLVLPNLEWMSLKVLEKLEALQAAGGRIVGAVKPRRIPGLAGYPASDEELKRRVEKLWAKLFVGTAEEALRQYGIALDFAADKDSFAYTHRDYGEAGEAYFVAMPNETNETVACSFRVMGKAPELWDAETGERRLAEDWWVKDGRTFVRFELKPSGALFVVFREAGTAPVQGRTKGQNGCSCSVQELDRDWVVRFPTRGREMVKTFPQLISWSGHEDDEVKYFSGTATYEKELMIATPSAGERLILDLGSIKNIAEVTLDGVTYPTLWRPPYAVDITEQVRAAGGASMFLKVRVTNLWVNRLIGDDVMFAEDCQWKKADWKQAIVKLPDWVKRGEESPTGRATFTTWKHWNKTDKPIASGLLGPVRIKRESNLL